MLALILALHVHIISYAIRYSRVPPYLQRAEEFEFYQQLFAIASPDGRDALDQQVAANFLAASHLPQEMLHQIWHFATSLQSYTQEYLTTEGFFLACRLVAWAQNGGTPLDMVHAHQPPPLLPDFPGLRRPPSSVGSRPQSIGGSEVSEMQPVIRLQRRRLHIWRVFFS